MSTRVFKRAIGDTITQIILDPAILEMTGDLETDSGTVAGTVGLVTELLADAVQDYAALDAEYRNWRGIRTGQLLAQPGNEKMPEWKLKADLEAEPQFLTHKNNLAATEGDIEFLKGFVDAMRHKSEMIKVRSNMRNRQDAVERGNLDTRPESDGGAVEPARRGRVRG